MVRRCCLCIRFGSVNPVCLIISSTAPPSSPERSSIFKATFLIFKVDRKRTAFIEVLQVFPANKPLKVLGKRASMEIGRVQDPAMPERATPNESAISGAERDFLSFGAVAERRESMERRGRKSRRRRRWRAKWRAHHRTKTLSRRAAEQSKRSKRREKAERKGVVCSPEGATGRRRRACSLAAVAAGERESGNRATDGGIGGASERAADGEEEEFSSI